MKRKSIKSICFVIPSLNYGGAERVLVMIANYLDSLGLQVTIVKISSDNKDSAYELRKNIEVYYISTNNYPPIFRTLLRLYKLRKLVNRISPDIVISFVAGANITTLLSLIFSNIPIIISERNDPNLEPNSRIKRKFRDYLYNLSDGCVFQTEEAKSYFNKKIQSSSKVIFNPIETEKLPDFIEEKTKNNIVAVGRLEHQKNFNLLLDAFYHVSKKYPCWELEIYGQGSQKDILKKKIETLNLEKKVHLMGVVNNIPETIRYSKIFVMTSNFEGMPNALIEAMSMGLACISSDCSCGGPRELIQHNQNGKLFKVGDMQDLIYQMIELIEDDNMIKNLGKEALLIREKLGITVIAKQWLNFMEDILNKK